MALDRRPASGPARRDKSRHAPELHLSSRRTCIQYSFREPSARPTAQPIAQFHQLFFSSLLSTRYLEPYIRDRRAYDYNSPFNKSTAKLATRFRRAPLIFYLLYFISIDQPIDRLLLLFAYYFDRFI